MITIWSITSRNVISIPLTVLGRGREVLKTLRSSSSDMVSSVLPREVCFVFKGKYRAVLISYPNPVEKAVLIEKAMTKQNV